MSEAAPDVREVLEAAYNRIFCRDTLAGFICEPCDRLNRFTRFLDAEAYTDAALMLIPEKYQDDYIITSHGAFLGPNAMYYDEGEADFYAYADCPALAIAAASLRAKGTGA